MGEAGLRVDSILQVTEVVELMRNREINGRIHVTDQLFEDFIEYRKVYGSQVPSHSHHK